MVRDQRGAVYVEFLIVLMPLLVLWLSLAQLCFLGVAKLVVHHAAVTACRAAVVVLDDDPKRYAAAPRGTILDGEKGTSSPLQAFLDRIPASDRLPKIASAKGNARYDAIRGAAYLPLLALSPDYAQLFGSHSLASAFRGRASRVAVGLAATPALAAITFPTEPAGDELRTDLRGANAVTVRVTYLYACTIPVASKLICRTYTSQMYGDAESNLALAREIADPEALRRGENVMDRFQERIESWRWVRQDPANAELEHAEYSLLQLVGHASSARFFAIRSEATLPNQIAPYAYLSESEESGSTLSASGPSTGGHAR